MDNNIDDSEVKHQAVVEITVASILSSAINGIVGFIAVSFFKPIWDQIIAYWKKHD
jgi:hypothetical protein